MISLVDVADHLHMDSYWVCISDQLHRYNYWVVYHGAIVVEWFLLDSNDQLHSNSLFSYVSTNQLHSDYCRICITDQLH